MTVQKKGLESIFGFGILYELMWGMKEHHIQSYYLMIREKAREHQPMTRQEFENLRYD